MRTLPILLTCLLVCAGPLATAAPPLFEAHAKTATPRLTARVAAPGFLLLDEHWYVFDASADLSSGVNRIRMNAMGEGRMFLHGWASSQNCTATTPNGTPPAGRLGIGEAAGVEEITVPLSTTRLQNARVYLFHCDGVWTVAVRSPAGDIRCNNPVPRPFTLQQCPALRNLPRPGLIFESGFEP